MDTMKDTKMQPATDAVIEELRMLAEDLYVNGYNRYSSAMSQAADELERLRAKIAAMEKQEPAGYGVRYVEPANGEEDWDSIWMHRVFAEDHIKDFTQAYVDIGEPVGAITVVPLYALPGATGEEK